MEYLLILNIIVIITFFSIRDNDIIVDDINWYQYINKPGINKLYGIGSLITSLKHKFYGCGTLGKNIVLDNYLVILINCMMASSIYTALGMNKISFFTALLFILHPINNQLTVWKNGRRFCVNIILVMLMLIYPLFSPLFYLITPLYQINAIFSPVLLSNINILYILLIPSLLFISLNNIVKKIDDRKSRIKDKDRLDFNISRFIIVVKYYGSYIFRILFPSKSFMIQKELHFWGVTKEGNIDAYSINIQFIKGIISLLVSVSLLFIIPNEYKPYLLFSILSILQWCAIIPVIQDLADRYSSIGSIFILYLIVVCINKFLPDISSTILIGLSIYYFVNLKTTMLMYKDFPSYWDYYRYFQPEIPSPRKFEIDWLLKRNNYIKAWVLISEGLKYNPNDFMILYQASMCAASFGHNKQALDYINKASLNYYIDQEDSQSKTVEQIRNKLEEVIKNEEKRQRR